MLFLFRKLEENLLNCNCHLKWFSEWLVKRPLLSSHITCNEPEKLKNFIITDVQLNSFVCNDQTDTGCLGNEYCPINCTCAGTIIRCSKNYFVEIPSDVPNEATEL